MDHARRISDELREGAPDEPGLAEHGEEQHGVRITALTAYDAPMARLLNEAGVDVILVGDSLGMVKLGYESTLPVTVDEILHHTKAVKRGNSRALLVADLPFLSYEIDPKEALRKFKIVVEVTPAGSATHEKAKNQIAAMAP